MTNTVFKIFLMVTAINLVTLLVAGFWQGIDTNGQTTINNQLNSDQYYSELYMNEENANNLKTESQEIESTATNSMKYSKGFWGMMLDGFKTMDFDGSQYNNPIEKALAITLSWFRGTLIAINGLLIFLVLKNKMNG